VIVATAGHVDHGKTSLVRALTGVDTDRLPEERRRGMSIDLGFAYLPREDRTPIAFVDVPGHERFIRNMTAGVPGIDLALLVVAADDGPMPQTREHLEILDRLGAPRLLAVLSKVDRVSAERVVAATAELRTVLDEGRFQGAEILPVSPIAGTGMSALRARLESLADALPSRVDTRRFRLHVDRAFVIDGIGLVATGSVLSGNISTGDTVQLLPTGRTARVRSLRADNSEVARATAGQRCALAVHGFSRGDVARGDILVDAGAAPRSRHLDVRLDPLRGARETALRAAQVSVHLGTTVLAARLTPLSREDRRYARLSFSHSLSAWHGDRLLLRDSGTQQLVAAGVVLDPMPPDRGASRPERLALLAQLDGTDAEAILDTLLSKDAGVLNMDWFAAAFHLPPVELVRIASSRALVSFSQRGARHVMRSSAWTTLCDALERAVREWHTAHPESVGPRPAEAGMPLTGVVDFLLDAGRLVRDGPSLRLPAHRARLSAQDELLWEKVAPLLESAGVRPPRVLELAAHLATSPEETGAFLQRLARAGRVYRVAPNRFFLPAAVERLVALAATLEAESEDRGFAAATYRDRSGLGRNLTIEVLEFLDASGYTRRAGAVRRMRRQ